MMYTPRARLAFQYQQFFFEQREKLSSLLNTVSIDARVANGQQVCLDYFELTTVVTQLLSEAQDLSTLTCDQLERGGVQTQPFAEKVQIVETLATELRTRVSASQKAVSKKRGRSMDDDEDEVDMDFAVKRYRNAPVDHDMLIEPAFCGPYAERFLQNAWWSQPIYE